MGRGAHAAHAAYNGSGTQGISVTDKIKENEDIHSVFITENDTYKQILHGHDLSEMTCAGKTEGITSERYKIFTPDENSDLIGDVYLNFEMDSEITDFVFEDTTPEGRENSLQNITQEDLSKSFSMGGEDYKSMTVDYSNNSLPTVVNSTTNSNVSYINKTLNVTYDNINYEIVVGKGTDNNIAVKNLSNNIWSNHNIANFSEIIDVIMINIDNKDLLIVGGRPPTTTTTPYKVVDLSNSGTELTELTVKDLNVPVGNNYLNKDFNIIVKIFYENRSLIMSGFKYHDNEVLRAPDSYFHTNDVKYQTSFIIQNLQYNSGSALLSGIIKGVTFTPARKTASKRLESYNYKDCILSSSIKYDDTNYAYITGSKEKVLLALSPNQDNNEIKRSYDNGLNWEDVNFYQTSDNYYPMSALYRKNETLVHRQLNIFGFMTNDLTNYKIDKLKKFIVDTYGYIKSDIKVINKRTKMEYDDDLTLDDIKTLDPVLSERVKGTDITSATQYDFRSCLDIRIKDSPIINDYEHVWVNIRKDTDNFKKIWPLGKNIRMTSKKPYGAITRIIVTNGGMGYTSAPTVTISSPASEFGTTASATAVLTNDVVTSIIVDSGGSGYDGAEDVLIGGNEGATAIIDKYSVYKEYLTLAEFKQNISGMLDLTTSDYDLKIYYTLQNETFTGTNTDNDDKSVFELGLLQVKKIDILATATWLEKQNGDSNFIRLGGTTESAEFKPVDERLNDKFKIYLVIDTNETVVNLKTRLVNIYGGNSDGSDYLICDKTIKMYIIPPTVTIDPPLSGETATATAVLTNGVVTSITVNSGGTGYTSPPTVTIDPPLSGETATATAVTNGVVTSITVNSGGTGYTSHSNNQFADSKVVYGTPDPIITSTSSNNSIVDTYAQYNLELRFANTHPILLSPDPKIVYVSIPMNLGNGIIERHTVSLLAEDLSTRVYITLGQLKNKIKSLLDPLYTALRSSTSNYALTLVKGGSYNGNVDNSNNNFYAGNSVGVPHFDDSLKIDDENVGIQSGNILYFYFAYIPNQPYVRPTTQMTNLINISLGTDPLYSEKIISRLGVMDDLKYYIPNVNILVNNDKGLWVAAGTPSDDPDFIMTGQDSDIPSNLIEEALKRPNLVVFVSNNDGYDWHPVKFSVIKNNTLGILYKDADVDHYDDPKYKIEYVSGYVSNLRGDIRITFNIYDTSINLVNGSIGPGNLVTSGVLDIDHYKICPDVISNHSLKAIKMSHIIDNLPQDYPLTHALSIRNTFDIYTFSGDFPTTSYTGLTARTIDSNIIYTYNEKNKILGEFMASTYDASPRPPYLSPPEPLRHINFGSYFITVLLHAIPSAAYWRLELFRKNNIDGNSEIITIGGESYKNYSTYNDYILKTDSNKKAVLILLYTDRTDIYTYDDINLNFKKVATLQYKCNNINFLENVWIISGDNKLVISYDAVHWREINTNTKINEIFSKTNRYHDSILDSPTIDDNGDMSFRPKILTNTIDRYKSLSLFHDRSIRGGIKVNIDEELVADRTNYIIDCYSLGMFLNPDGFLDFQYYNQGILYKPNDIVRIGDRYIICGNNSGLTNGSYEILSLMESRSSEIANNDDIIFLESKSLYTAGRPDYSDPARTYKKDFINNFNMERFYIDPNVTGNIVYCSGSYTHSNGKKYGILAIRSKAAADERHPGHGRGSFYWKLLYAPPISGTDEVPIDTYEIKSDFENDIRAPWQDTMFEKINDLVFADNKAVVVGKGKKEFNLCYSSIDYPEFFGIYNSNINESQVKLNFQEIHTICFFKGYWFVGGKPIYQSDSSDNLVKNNYCLAYASNMSGVWTYEDFPSQASDSSIYEVNNMEAIDINGNRSILTNISYIKKYDGIENLVMAVLFIDIDYLGNLTFTNHVQFDTPGIKEIEETGRKWNLFDLDGSGYVREEKWLNRPFNLEIEGIDRSVISSVYSYSNNDMYYVEYNSTSGFILISYKDPYIPNIDKTEFGEYPKFIKHIKLGSKTLTNNTRGHCYKIAKITNENFITGLNSARYVAVGKGILSPISYSDDFENWTYSDAGNIFDIVFDVAHKHGIWIAIGEGNYNVGISKDGKSWTGIYPIEERENLITTTYDSTLNSLSFSSDTKITDILPYVPNLKGIFLRNLSILRLFSRIEYHVGTQIWQTLTFDDIKAMLDTEFGAGEYAKLLKNCSTINKNGSTKLTSWIPGFTKTLNSKLETFVNVSENGSFPSGLLKDQKLSIKVYYNNLENVIGNELVSSNMNNAVFDNFMNNTLIPCDRNPNYFIDSFIADNYGFQLGDTYQNINGNFKLKFSTEIQRMRLYCKRFELDEIEINEFNKGVKQMPKITQGLYFDADNVGYLLLDLDSFNLYASHIIVSGWLTSGVYITDMNLQLNGHSYQKVIEPSVIDYATKTFLGLNYNRYTFNDVDKEDGTGSLVIPLASTAYSGSSVPLDRYGSIRLRINFNTLAGPKSYINVTCVGTTTVSYINSTANIDLY